MENVLFRSGKVVNWVEFEYEDFESKTILVNKDVVARETKLKRHQQVLIGLGGRFIVAVI